MIIKTRLLFLLCLFIGQVSLAQNEMIFVLKGETGKSLLANFNDLKIYSADIATFGKSDCAIPKLKQNTVLVAYKNKFRKDLRKAKFPVVYINRQILENPTEADIRKWYKKEVPAKPVKPNQNKPQITLNADKAQATQDYLDNYVGSEIKKITWSGDTKTCKAGDTSPELKHKVLQRINYFRRIAGLSDSVALNPAKSAKCQKAALMMAANFDLNHYPPKTWKCYTEEGAIAAGSSNLALGHGGPSAIDAYIRDKGTPSLGHRQWVLLPGLWEVGTGDTDNFNVLWVINDYKEYKGKSYKKPEYVAFPPQGYVPIPVVEDIDTWSFQIHNLDADADYSKAVVTMKDAQNKPITIAKIQITGSSGKLLSWQPEINYGLQRTEIIFWVSVRNVVMAGKVKNYDYKVILFQP
jgi:hypothetical protein